MLNILDRFGFPVAAFARIKGGRGVVGRTGQVMIVALIVLGSIAWRISNENFLMISGAAIIVFVVAIVLLLLRWAEKNPELAVMEGLDLAAYRQAEVAALGMPQPPGGPAVADPGTITIEFPSARRERKCLGSYMLGSIFRRRRRLRNLRVRFHRLATGCDILRIAGFFGRSDLLKRFSTP